MDKPAIPANCNTCHRAASFGSGSCAERLPRRRRHARLHPAAGQDLHRLPQRSGLRPLHGPGQLHHLPHDVAGYHHLSTDHADRGCSDCHDGTPASAKTQPRRPDRLQSLPLGHGQARHAGQLHELSHSAAHPEANQIAYTNDLACATPPATGNGIQHDPTPALGKTCTDCHTAQASGHNEGLGTCSSCHTDIAGYHHGTATAGDRRLRRLSSDQDQPRLGPDRLQSLPLGHGQARHAGQLSRAVTAPPLTPRPSRSPTPTTSPAPDAACHAAGIQHDPTPALGKTCTDCHTAQASGHNEGLGTCSSCHTDIEGYHHGTATAGTGDCAGCHTTKTNHDGLTDCESCHSGMDKPAMPANCTSCHSSAAHPEAKQIAYTNDLACADAACHAAGIQHDPTPALGKTCTDCHTAQASGHNEGLGTCSSCHTDIEGYHHGTATAGTGDCAGCHTTKTNHDGLTDCESCHSGMDRPVVPGTCSTCHTAATYGTGKCTICHGGEALVGKDQVHSSKPQSLLACADCHQTQTTGHYEGIAACKTCHTDALRAHHLG